MGTEEQASKQKKTDTENEDANRTGALMHSYVSIYLTGNTGD